MWQPILSRNEQAPPELHSYLLAPLPHTSLDTTPHGHSSKDYMVGVGPGSYVSRAPCETTSPTLQVACTEAGPLKTEPIAATAAKMSIKDR